MPTLMKASKCLLLFPVRFVMHESTVQYMYVAIPPCRLALELTKALAWRCMYAACGFADGSWKLGFAGIGLFNVV